MAREMNMLRGVIEADEAKGDNNDDEEIPARKARAD